MEEVKDYLSIGHTDTSADVLLAQSIAMARSRLEHFTGHILTRRKLTVDPRKYRTLPRPVVNAVRLDGWDKAAGGWVPIPEGEYDLTEDGKLYVRDYWDQELKLEYLAGYATGECPAEFLLAIKAMVRHVYERMDGDPLTEDVKRIVRRFKGENI